MFEDVRKKNHVLFVNDTALEEYRKNNVLQFNGNERVRKGTEAKLQARRQFPVSSTVLQIELGSAHTTFQFANSNHRSPALPKTDKLFAEVSGDQHIAALGISEILH